MAQSCRAFASIRNTCENNFSCSLSLVSAQEGCAGDIKKEKRLKRNRLQTLHFNILDVPKSLAFKYILV